MQPDSYESLSVHNSDNMALCMYEEIHNSRKDVCYICLLYIFPSRIFVMCMACMFKELLTLLPGGDWETENREGGL